LKKLRVLLIRTEKELDEVPALPTEKHPEGDIKVKIHDPVPKKRIGFEGGQMPIHRRLPKRGFRNIFRKEYSIVNLGDITNCKKIDQSQPITVAVLADSGLIRNQKLPVKVLGDGTLEAALTIEAQKFSASAEKKIQDAGGKATVIQ
jgi:large subunit ribosomal protein L15